MIIFFYARNLETWSLQSASCILEVHWSLFLSLLGCPGPAFCFQAQFLSSLLSLLLRCSRELFVEINCDNLQHLRLFFLQHFFVEFLFCHLPPSLFCELFFVTEQAILNGLFGITSNSFGRGILSRFFSHIGIWTSSVLCFLFQLKYLLGMFKWDLFVVMPSV